MPLKVDSIIIIAKQRKILKMEKETQQRLLELATGTTYYKANKFSHFAECDVISSMPYKMKINKDGDLVELIMYLRIQNINMKVFGIELYEMYHKSAEEFQNALPVRNEDYFEKTLMNIPIFIDRLHSLGYEFDRVERIFRHQLK